jgi:hypothetical protein
MGEGLLMRTVTWKRSVSLAVVIAVFVASAAAQAVPSGAWPVRARQAPEQEAPDEVRSNSDEAMAKHAGHAHGRLRTTDDRRPGLLRRIAARAAVGTHGADGPDQD